MGDPWLQKFKAEVLPQIVAEFSPSLVLLFGSRVRGDAEEDADVDVVIVSEAFAGIPFIKRMPAVLKNIDFEKHIDAVCYLPDEFERMKEHSAVLMDALEYGELIRY
jgi:predicted nucleotidyltransferase